MNRRHFMRIDMGTIRPVDNGVNIVSNPTHRDHQLWTHFAPDPQANEIHIAVSGVFNGHTIERLFSFTEREINESGKTAMEMVYEQLNAAYPVSANIRIRKSREP